MASETPSRQLVGVVPAAGWGRRSESLPCSKEIFPIGFARPARAPDDPPRPMPACAYLLEALAAAGAARAHVILRPGKWDIPRCLGDGSDFGIPLSYLMIPNSPGVPWTVRQALPFLDGAQVLFGFPDIVFRPGNALKVVNEYHQGSSADIVLGLFAAHQPQKMDMVALGRDGEVIDIVIKPRETPLRDTWILASWSPTFTSFLVAYLSQLEAGWKPGATGDEVHLGHVVQAASAEGLRVEGVRVSEDATYRDIGTPDELVTAVRDFC